MCQFEHEGKKIKLTPYRPIAKRPKLNLPKSRGVNLISATKRDQILAAREVVKMLDSIIPRKVTP